MLFPMGLVHEDLWGSGAFSGGAPATEHVRRFERFYDHDLHQGVITSLEFYQKFLSSWGLLQKLPYVQVLCREVPKRTNPLHRQVEFFQVVNNHNAKKLLGNPPLDPRGFYLVPTKEVDPLHFKYFLGKWAKNTYIYLPHHSIDPQKFFRPREIKELFKISGYEDGQLKTQPLFSNWNMPGEILPTFIKDYSTIHDQSDATDPKLSVIIPTYNKKEELAEVLKALLDMDGVRGNLEILVIDDSQSPQFPEELHDKFHEQKVSLRYIHCQHYDFDEKPYIPGAKRNLGARLSQAPNLLFLDSDIILSPGFFEEALNTLTTANLFTAKRRFKDKDSGELVAGRTPGQAHYWNRFFEAPEWKGLLHPWKYTSSFCLGMTRPIFFQSGGFREGFCVYGCEDTELGYRLFQRLDIKPQVIPLEVLHLDHSTDKSPYGFDEAKRDKFINQSAAAFYNQTLETQLFEIYPKLAL